MLFMDDYFLKSQIDTSNIQKYIAICQKYNAGNLRLFSSTYCKTKDFSPEVGQVVEGSAYSISTQAEIWNVDFLQNIIHENWSAWDFERLGSLCLVNLRQPILYTKNYTFPYVEAVRRGKWLDDGIKLCTRHGYKLDFYIRAKMSFGEKIIIFVKGTLLKLMPKTILKVQRFLQEIRK